MVAVSVPHFPFRAVDLPELTPGFGWLIQFHPEDTASLVWSDVWELHIVGGDDEIVLTETEVNSPGVSVVTDAELVAAAHRLLAHV